MASLDNFFNTKESKLVDLTWLDISQDDYENLPFDATPSHISVPKLEEAWMHLEDSNTRLVPNIDLNFNPTPAPAQDLLPDVNSLLNYTKRQMMAGKSGDDLIEAIREKATPNLIKAAYAELQKLSKEQGLLGSVYVDPTVFSKCTDGAEFVSKRAKTARYVKAMDKCSGCFYNKQSRCEVYKRVIAKEINYGEEIFNFYSKHFSTLVGKNVVIASKSELQRKFLEKEKEVSRVAEFKPSSKEFSEKTLEEKSKEYQEQLEGLSKELSSISKTTVAQDVSMLLVKGYSGKVIRDYIKNKYSYDEFNSNRAVFDSVLSKQGSLGTVFLEADKMPREALQSEKEMHNFLSKYASRISCVVLAEKDQNKDILNAKLTSVCSKLGKKVFSSLNEIPQHYWQAAFDQYPAAITNKLASVFESNPVKGLRLAFIQRDLAQNNASVVEAKDDFSLKASLDTTEYTPSEKQTVYFSAGKVASALDQGYTLSSIVKTAKKLGLDDSKIASSITKALESRDSIHRYQYDFNFKLPDALKVVATQKDVSLDLAKPSRIASFDSQSTSAPVDTSVLDLGLQESSLDTSDVSKKASALEVDELDTLGF